jgi:hypothetical protein
MREKLPLAFLVVMGILGITGRFIPHPAAEAFNEYLRNSVLRIVGSFALILGLGNLLLSHKNRISRKAPNWRQSYTVIISFFAVAIIGVFGGPNGQGPMATKIFGFPFDLTTLYNKLLTPLGATLFALLAFYMASAAYRSFRAKTAMAALLLGSAFIVMLGQVPVGELISPYFPKLSAWLMQVPNTASKRGIDVGVTLAATGTLLKILTGVERSWMGGGK